MQLCHRKLASRDRLVSLLCSTFVLSFFDVILSAYSLNERFYFLHFIFQRSISKTYLIDEVHLV